MYCLVKIQFMKIYKNKIFGNSRMSQKQDNTVKTYKTEKKIIQLEKAKYYVKILIYMFKSNSLN